MKPTNSKYKIPLALTLSAVILFAASLMLYCQDKNINWKTELAKALMNLGMTAIIGGFIKYFFDQYQLKQAGMKEQLVKEEAKKTKQKEFRQETLNHLRKIFDLVDTARLLIEAHKSAKTYGEQMRLALIPSIVSLYDIKRNLADSFNMIDAEKIKELRLSLHYMIAYLQALANEYKDKYLTISNIQYYEEEWKKQKRDLFLKDIVKDQSNPTLQTATLDVDSFHDAPGYAWQQIEHLPVLWKFIQDDYDSLYRKLFVDFYEYSKRILKEQETKHVPKKSDAKYLTILNEIDLKKSKGELTINDSLVNRIMNDLIKTNT